MSLTALQWRMLPEYFMPISGTVNTVSQSILNDRINILNGIYNSFTSSVYHDGSTRTTGSNGWSFFKSGSNLEKDSGTNVVYGYPPTLTLISQSIIFAAGPTGSIIPTTIKLMNSYGMFSTVGYDIQPTASFNFNNTASIYVGVSKNSGIYKYFANTNPMETGSNVTTPSSSFSGYLRTSTPAKIYKMRIGNIKISIHNPPLIIPEIGINHGGKIDVACKIVQSAKKAGAKIIKNQTHIANDEYSIEAKKIIQIGSSGPTSHTVLLCTSTLVEKLAVPAIRISEISVEPRPTSYEILCAADRSPPRKAYLELLDHPALITECTLSDEIAKRNSSPSRKSARNAPSPIGNTIHPVLASPKVKIGDTRKINVLALLGRIDSLTKSFIASVSG